MAAACKTPEDFATIADTLDRAAERSGSKPDRRIFCTGFQGNDNSSDEMLIRSIPHGTWQNEPRVQFGQSLRSTKTGINMDAVKLMGEIVIRGGRTVERP